MADTENSDLLGRVKRRLRVDPDDTAEDEYIAELIENSREYLLRRLAINDGDFDFNEPGEEQTLLTARVFYDYNDALDEFEENYAKSLDTVRSSWVVKQYVDGQQEDSDV